MNILPLHLAIFRLTVIVSWNIPVDRVLGYARLRGCEFSDEWKADLFKGINGAIGFCSNLGPGNSDVLVWVKHPLGRKSTSREFGTLYHELFHAVDKITKERNLHGEEEARAYIYEWLVTECNKFFWRKA